MCQREGITVGLCWSDKEEAIQQATVELEEKAAILSGLDDKVKEIRDDIRQKARALSMCQG